jgi:hypothetical protein
MGYAVSDSKIRTILVKNTIFIYTNYYVQERTFKISAAVLNCIFIMHIIECRESFSTDGQWAGKKMGRDMEHWNAVGGNS